MTIPFYRQGTITLTEGSAVVTGAITGWTEAFAREGDFLYRKDPTLGVLIPINEIASVESETSLTLREPWEGATMSGIAYAITPTALIRNSIATLNFQIATFVQNLPLLTSGEGAPSVEFGSNGWYYFREDAPEYYRKVSGAWEGPVSLTGPPGPDGPTYATSSTTPLDLSPGAKPLTVAAGKAFQNGARIRLSSAANPATHYMEGVVSGYSGTSLSFTADKVVGSGTRADWLVNIAGDVGSKGDTGASFAATSATSLDIATGSKAFAVPAGLAYSAGQRVVAASVANVNNYMEGVVASYIGTTLTVTVDRVGGSGTFADWAINLIGRVGNTGPGYGGTSSSNRTLGASEMTFTVPANLAYTVGARVRFAATASPSTNYMEGVITGYAGTAMTILFERFVGTGTFNSWGISLVGDKGDTGPSGAQAYKATSTSSLSIAIATRVFETQAGLAYQAGTRVRAASASAPSNWMEGVATGYSGTSLTVSIDKIGGSGTRNDWNLSLAGQPGIDGTGSGTVNEASNGIELTGGGSGVQLTDTGVVAGEYTAPTITVDAKGRVTAIESVTLTDPVAMAIIFGG